MNVKKGDLAIVVEGLLAENTGRVVKIVEFYGDRKTQTYGLLKNMWYVEMVGAPAVTVLGDLSKEGIIEDHRLRPISGLKDEDVVDEELEVPA